MVKNQKIKKRKSFPSVKEILARMRERKEKKQEVKEAQELAIWSLTKFTSGEIKIPKRSLQPNKHQNSIKIADLVDGKATILRMKGEFRHRDEKHFWSIITNIRDNYYVVFISTKGKDMKSLDPIIEGYELGNFHEIDIEKRKTPFLIEFAVNFLYNLPQNSEVATTEKIDIMFAGSPEIEKIRKKKLSLVLATEKFAG